ncbi:unnamed protein product [Euphydryas editha]|uniref:Uncharacterized protein n=1 Tax=Euphydryas editha TaxID=104508 RepID=A0AAU9UMW9_EUPED|nr:unnamed protein product [Euphydryas editha]
MEALQYKRGAELETYASPPYLLRTCIHLSFLPGARDRDAESGLWCGDVTARGGRTVSVRPAAELNGRVHDARAVNKTIAMLFESPNAKLFPAFNIPPPVRLR